jgi:hypothetical protein
VALAIGEQCWDRIFMDPPMTRSPEDPELRYLRLASSFLHKTGKPAT